VPGPDGQAVQFVFVPYPFASRYDLSTANYMSKEELHSQLQAKVAEWLQTVHRKPEFDATLPTVLVGHLHVRGAEIHTVYKMNAADDVQFNFADLNPQWAYVALGHIHKPQTLNGSASVRYSGSLDRLDMAEDHDHGAVLFEIGAAGLANEPQWLPIPATPFHEITLADVDAELPGLAEKYADRAMALVKVNVEPRPMAISRDELARKLRKIFPRLYGLNWLVPETERTSAAGPRVNVKAALGDTVREYLAGLGELQADPDKEGILQVLDSFLKEGAA